jgi:hypothetical protein
MKLVAKSVSIESILTAITGKNRAAVIEAGECVFCNATNLAPDSFVDDLSRTEYTISGMCQDCQDKAFGVDPFDISQDF